MVFDPLAAFNLSERIAFPFIQSLVGQPISANEILRRLDAATVGNTAFAGLRRTSGLALIRQAWSQYYGEGVQRTLRNGQFVLPTAAQAKGRPYTTFLGNDTKPDPNRFGVAATKTSSLYTYKVRLEYRIPGVRGIQKQYVNVSTDILMTKNMVYDVVNEYALETPVNYPFEYSGMMVEDAIRSASPSSTL